MDILDSINKVILSSSETPEESIRYFLKMVIDGAKSVSLYCPRTKEAKVLPLKNLLIERKISGIDIFIEEYSSYHLRITLSWADLAKRWNRHNDLEIKEILKKEVVLFKDDLTQAFDGVRDASLEHLADIEFILRNYQNLTKTQKNLLNKKIKLKGWDIILCLVQAAPALILLFHPKCFLFSY